jgi:hypothetical protein
MAELLDTTPATSSRRQRRERIVSPRDFIKELQALFPDDSPEEICEQYRQHVREKTRFDDLAIEALVMGPLDEWLKANVGGARRRRAAPERSAQAKEMLIGEMAQRHAALVEAEATIRLLEYQTTYGKALGDCTGAECRRLSVRYGDFFAELAKRLRPSDHVGQHLSEAELQAIARTHRLIGPNADR